MNLQRGLTRLWITGSCVWIAAAAFSAYEQHKPMGALDAEALRRLAELEAREAAANPFLKYVQPAPLAPTPQSPRMFDDLIPKTRPSSPGMFNDLIPAAPAAPAAPGPWTLYQPKRWDAARIGAFLSAVLTNGILPPALGYAGLFVLMQLTRWIAAGFKGG